MWLTYASAWIATAAAVIAGIYLTGSAWCLWALFIPAMIGIIHTDDNEDNDKENKDVRIFTFIGF